MHRRGFMALALAGIAAAGAWPILAQPAAPTGSYQARLSTVPIDLAMASVVAGSGAVTAMLKGRTLSLTGRFRGLKSPATVVRLHRGPNRGIRGPSIGELAATPALAGDITGSVELTALQVEDLEKGRLYVQLHSEKAPDGNLWGWLLAK